MKSVFIIFLTFLTCQLTLAVGPYTVCFYDASSSEKEGLAKFSISDMEIALDYCTHLVYGYVGLNPENLKLMGPNNEQDKAKFLKVTALKEKFPYVKFLLSVGGGQDLENSEKYIQLLEGGKEKQAAFIEAAHHLVRGLNFDGLDLSYPLPRNKPRKVHSGVGTAWKSLKKMFTGDSIIDEKADEHKEQFTELVKNLKTTLKINNLMLSLTVLPNVNSTLYFNVPALTNDLDFVNLATFDFTTPERNPNEADYTAPFYSPPLEGNRLPYYNVDFQVDHWVSQRFPKNKINVGVASYGRAWKMTRDSKTEGIPIVASTDGPAEAGAQTKTAGVLNWAEICLKLRASGKAEAPLRRVTDPSKKYGTYAFRPADANGDNGIWVSYDDPEVAATKASYVWSQSLGGMALFDLNLDDFRGQCTSDKFPILRAVSVFEKMVFSRK